MSKLSCLERKVYFVTVSSVRNSNDAYRGVTQPPNSPVTTSPGSCQLRRWSYDRIDETYPACTDAAASSCLLTANNGTAACHNRRRPIPAKQLTADGHLVGVTDVNIQILLQVKTFSEKYDPLD